MASDDIIGFVGVGNMGAPMARNLLKAGHRVRLFDLDAKALAPFREVERAEIAASLRELGTGLSTVVTMVADGKVVQQAALGPQGFAATMADGGLLVDMSSSFPMDTRALAEALSARGLGVVDAPVSGGVPRAILGTLAIIAGGRSEDVDRVEPMLKAMGSVIRTGPLGSGHAMKSLNNYLSAVGLIALSEALVVGARFGLDPHVVTQVLNNSTGKNNATENKAEKHLIPRKFDSGFTLGLLEKDVGMARRLAADLGVEAATLAEVSDYLTNAMQVLGRDADHTAVYLYAEGRRDRG